jgi:molecular chaperone GrpE
MEAQLHRNGHNLLPPAELILEIQKLQEDLAHERDKNLRTLADFTNFRRRIERNDKTAVEEETRKIILPFLDIVDDLEKALKWMNKDDPDSANGVRLIHHKLLVQLESLGVIPFDSSGVPFDHDLHEAVAIDTGNENEPGTVVDELRRGYRWNSTLLRAAQVRIAVR